MQIKTIETVAGVNKINFGNDDHNTTAHFYWLKNLSDSTLYVSAKSNPIIGADDVAELLVNSAVAIETDEGKIYIIGAGKVEIHRTDSKICPFRYPSSGSDGGDIKNPDTVYYSLKNAGYNVTSDPNTWSDTIRDVYKDYDYRLDYSGTIFRFNNYEVTRSSDKLAYCGWTTIKVDGHFQPILISAYPEAVQMTMRGHPSENFEAVIDGQTVYWSRCWEESVVASDSSEYNRRYLGIYTDDSQIQLYNEIKMCGYSLYE